MSALCAWLVRQCDEFVSPISGNVVQRVPSRVLPHLVPRLSRTAPVGSPAPLEPSNPFSVVVPPLGPLEPANPFSAAAPTVPQVPREVASDPFVALHPGPSPAPIVWWTFPKQDPHVSRGSLMSLVFMKCQTRMYLKGGPRNGQNSSGNSIEEGALNGKKLG